MRKLLAVKPDWDLGFEFRERLIEPDLLTSLRADLVRVLVGPRSPRGGSPAGASAHHLAESTLRWQRYRSAQSHELLHSLSRHPGLVASIAGILGCDPYCHPRRIIDMLPPQHWIPPHQDYFAIQGTTDVVIAWIPLEARTGMGANLHVSAWDGKGLRPLSWVGGVGGQNDLSPQTHEWASHEFTVGDVAFYHSLTSHYVSVNDTSRDMMALEFRYQRPREGICLASLRPHHFPRVPDWPSLTCDWSTRRWVARPAHARIVPFHLPLKIEDWHEDLSVGKSTLLQVS
jgi:hypothetical protein